MTWLESPVAPVFLVFCRVGGCLMVAPGFGSDRIPVQARLFIALAVSLALAPGLIAETQRLTQGDAARFAAAIICETIAGATLGLLARFYFLALETLATGVAMTFGLGNIFGAAVTDAEPTPALSSFIVICATQLVFATDQHLELIRALQLSYEPSPLAASLRVGALLDEVVRVLTQAHLLALRICSPFLLFGLVVNLALGLLARLAPQIQVYFVAGPLVILLGLVGLSLLAQDFFSAFNAQFGAWLLQG